MPPRLNLHANRLRANSFGGQAAAYDQHRPPYPDQLIDDLLADGAQSVLDVGAGTGIASRQFADRGAQVLAVEPDPRMASVARGKGIPVEIDTFEHWAPDGRRFDLVVFAASFHWVDPAVALPKIRTILGDHGHLALLWNPLTPTTPPKADFATIYADYFDSAATPVDGIGDLVHTITAAGYDVAKHTYPRTLQYGREQWLDFAFTHSNHITLPADRAAELRARLAELIGPDGVSVRAEALVLVASPTDVMP